MTEEIRRPQVKICGLTNAADAEACVLMGADAVGCVFFPDSPRHVTPEQARDVCDAVAGQVLSIGVFVDASEQEIMDMVIFCGLSGVQLHGAESPELASALRRQGLIVMKTLFVEKAPNLEKVTDYSAFAFLVECGRGALPGGNAQAWDWGAARAFGEKYPLVLAGGLAPDNVPAAIDAADPDAVDVSSGLEASPGKKDLEKIRDFMAAVNHCRPNQPEERQLRRIFK